MANKVSWPIWPTFDHDEESDVIRVIRSGQLFAAKEVRLFENEFSEYLGGGYPVACGNATQGLHLSLAALSIGKDDEFFLETS